MSTDIKPAWITVCGGHIFEGHQLHWANCFFSNATRDTIRFFLEEGSPLREDWAHPTCGGDGSEFTFEIREMTDEELEKYPEALAFCRELVAEYGEY